MILTCSQRTDICAFYSDWLLRRFREGFVDVRNPYAPRSVQRILLDPGQIEAMIIMTKNPAPLLPHLQTLSAIPLGFQITITPYPAELEPGVPDKRKIIAAFRECARQLGARRVILRYDPIFFTRTWDLAWHQRAFQRLCRQLEGACHQVIISELDWMRNTRRHQKELKALPPDAKRFSLLAESLVPIGLQFGMRLQMCAESPEHAAPGIVRRSCIDAQWIEQISGLRLRYPQGKARPHCDCLAVTDIGEYNCCLHRCRYCYANFDETQLKERVRAHDPASSLLIGQLQPDDQIRIKKQPVFRQIGLFSS